MPDGDGHQWGAFPSDNATIEALEGVDQEAEEMCSKRGGESSIKDKGEDSAKHGRKVFGSVFEQGPCVEVLSSLDVDDQGDEQDVEVRRFFRVARPQVTIKRG